MLTVHHLEEISWIWKSAIFYLYEKMAGGVCTAYP